MTLCLLRKDSKDVACCAKTRSSCSCVCVTVPLILYLQSSLPQPQSDQSGHMIIVSDRRNNEESWKRRKKGTERKRTQSHLSAKLRFSLSLSVCCLHYSKGHPIRRLKLAFFTVCSMQSCSTLLHINSGVYFSSSLSIYWRMSYIDPRIDLPCNPLPICLLQWAFKWFVRLSY